MPSTFLPLPVHTVERLKDLPQRVATLEGLIALWLFGSFARDAWTPISDVDLVYLVCEGWQGEALERFEARLYSIITSTLHEAMVDMARFRNLLVHLYWPLDHECIYDSLHGRCASLEACAGHIARWLQDQGEALV